MLRKWGMLVVMLLVAPALAFAQNTGKISGKVIDRANGEGLPGVNVVLIGTTYGSITDVDGNYFILGVPVGSYDVQASFVGFQTETFSGVSVSSGYTQEINFDLVEGVELDELIVEYERPLIQKDAVGAPKIVDAEQIVNLPVRGAAAVAQIQAGVVSQEGSNTLNVRGGRGAEVTYYIDGVKVIGTTSIPQSAIQEQEIMIGNISARYGDAMSGIISITTKSGAKKFFGSVEGVTSQALDSYGYNLFSGTIGGPIGSDKLSFFLSGEYIDQSDDNPRAIGELHLSDAILADINAAPQALRIDDVNGDLVYLPIPVALENGAGLVVDNDGHTIVGADNTISFTDGTVIAIPADADIESLNLQPVNRGSLLSPSDFVRDNKKLGNGSQNLSLSGNLQFSLFDQGRLRVGGRYNTGEFEGLSFTDVLFSPSNLRTTQRDEYQVFATWTQHLSNSTFYQLQADYTDYFTESFDARFGNSTTDFMRYGDVDGEAAWAVVNGYKRAPSNITEERVVGPDTFQVAVPTFSNTYVDSQVPASNVLLSLTSIAGGRAQSYSKSARKQFRLTGSATTQVGINQLEFGGEYETRTYRAFTLNAANLAGFAADGDPERVDPNDPLQSATGYDRYEDIPAFLVNNYAGGYGYDIYGNNEVDSESIEQFILEDNTKAVSAYDEKPYQPIYYGGYIQDKVEFRDIVLNMGVRVDIFDNNTPVLKDQYARRPISRAETISDRPSNIDADYAVYFSDNDDVIGYRDLEGRFFGTNGERVQAGEILLAGKPNQTSPRISAAMFEDYKPQVTFMPRIGVSFPVTDRALFFASYGVVAQRPSTNSWQSLSGYVGTGGINNTNLKPESTTKYELGFRQRLGERAALTISGFFQQIDNLIQQRNLVEAYPNSYTTYENVDFGTVKGMEFGFDMRRNNGLAANLNYTLSFADGTGSSATTTGTINWIDETVPNFISPLSFDQRHKLNASLDYRIGAGEGPSVGGMNILENFGANILFTAGSGFPYTGINDIGPVTVSRAPLPSGGVNGDRMPGSQRIDLKLDRRIPLQGKADVTVFLWVQNVLNSDNVQNVWRFTGLPDDDGYLSTQEGQRDIDGNPEVWETLYRNRTNSAGNFGIPRQTRLGIKLNF